MPKTKISEYSTTNSANTDIQSINIDEGCAPSGINNAIREIMVHLKNFQTGASSDPLTVAGAFVASSTATLNGTSIPASKTLADTDSSQTLTNKTISGSSNTFTNINLGSAVTSTLAIANGGTGSTTLAGANIGVINAASTWSAPQRGTVTTDNDGSFDLSVTNNFQCTPTGNFTLTFTNRTAGQSGFILLINTGGYTISAHADTLVQTGALATISAAGTYLISYFATSSKVYVTHSGAMA